MRRFLSLPSPPISMVIGLLAIAAIPTVTGVATAVSQRDQDQSSHGEDERMRKFNLRCYCTPNTPSARRINDGRVVLRDSKLFLIPQSEQIHGHLFEGFYIAYPDPDRPQPAPLGLVSTISDEPPVLNWIYVDKTTRELKYGNRTQSREHVVGSWDWEAGDEDGPGGLVLEGEEAAVAVRTSSGAWEIRWEDENGAVCVAEKEVVRISLERIMQDSTEDREREADGRKVQKTVVLTNNKMTSQRGEAASQLKPEDTSQVGNGKRRRRRRRQKTGPKSDITSSRVERPVTDT